MTTTETVVRYLLLLAAACFVLGLHLMNSPATARRGNLLSAGAMTVAVGSVVALVIDKGEITATGWIIVIVTAVFGALVGMWGARRVKMTDMPQLVSLFNAVGGGAAVLLAISHLMQANSSGIAAQITIPGGLDIIIGAVTFSGSLIAAGKLQGTISGNPVIFPGARFLTALMAVGFVVGTVWVVLHPDNMIPVYGLLVAGLIFGITMVMPIGGADMPVVISLLNAFTGTAVAMAGFVLSETSLIVAGALVGASGAILTKLMADAMNRSLFNIIVGGFGTGDSTGPTAGAGLGGTARSVSVDDVGIQLAYAQKVIVVPGYGLAAAQAQHELADLCQVLQDHGVDVTYAIHTVAGRMPGHMNVLLAEANVPYPLLKSEEEINSEFGQADVALVIGANDVVNPVARKKGNPISGMPILDVDKAKSVVVIKRSMSFGYAGIDNELFYLPNTGMLFADAKKGVTELKAAVRTFVG